MIGDEEEKIDLNILISYVLKYGVIMSSSIIVFGLILLLVHMPQGSPSSLAQVVATEYGRPTLNPAVLFNGLVNFDPLSIIEVGTLVLLATPLARVVASVFVFFAEKDMLYVGITLLVLIMLFVAIFVIGPVEG